MDREEQMLRELKVEDLKELHREIAEAVGMDGIIKLSDCFGGSSIYIPQRKELLKNLIGEKIRTEYDGTNIKKLSQKYDVSESFVYSVLRGMLLRGGDKREAKANVPGQYSFVDVELNIS